MENKEEPEFPESNNLQAHHDLASGKVQLSNDKLIAVVQTQTANKANCQILLVPSQSAEDFADNGMANVPSAFQDKE